MINYLYDILFLIPDDILEFLPPFCMLFLFAIFAGLRPRHIINFIKDPPIVPYIGFGQVKLWFTGVFIPILIIFIIIILTSIFSIVEQIQTNDWVEVDATVENAEERGETTCDGEGGCTTSYDTHVLYSYNYKNTEYYGYEYTYISEDFPGLEEDYPEGLEITVYVDPNNPSDSLMVKGWEGVWIEIVKMISILGFIFIALSSFLFVWRVAYQLQSAENKKIANEKPGKSGLWNAGLMNDFREIISFTKLMKKANEDVYEGEVKTLKFMIDGEEINKEVRKLNEAGVTIILTTHYLEEAEAMCDSLAIVNKGQIVAEGQTSAMLNKLDKKELIISLENNDANKIKLEGINMSIMSKNSIKISFRPSEINEGAIIEKIYNSGAKIKTINSKEPDLEELFLELTNEK